MSLNEIQDQLVSDLNQQIASGTIKIHKSGDKWFKHIRRIFPVRSSGIIWEEVYGCHSMDCSERLHTFADLKDTAIEFLKEFIFVAGLEAGQAYIAIGDDVTDVAFEMPASELLDKIGLFIEIPQGTYILPVDTSWCFAYTFPDVMYFGKSSNF